MWSEVIGLMNGVGFSKFVISMGTGIVGQITLRAPDKMHILNSKIPISLPKSMFFNLYESTVEQVIKQNIW